MVQVDSPHASPCDPRCSGNMCCQCSEWVNRTGFKHRQKDTQVKETSSVGSALLFSTVEIKGLESFMGDSRKIGDCVRQAVWIGVVYEVLHVEDH